jgi:hypothetical protein
MKRTWFLFLAFFIGQQAIFSQGFNWTDNNVIHYDIQLSVTDLSSHQIQGITTLTCVSQVNGLDSAHMYLAELAIDSILVNGAKTTLFNHDNDSIIKLQLPVVQQQGDTFQITVFYQGQPILDPSGFGGFYFSGDNLYAYNLGVAFSDDPHSYGRVWFPCVDAFTDKALYDFYITTTTPQWAICGGTLISKTLDTLCGTTVSHWKISQPTSPYLVSVAISDYVLVADTFDGNLGSIPIQIYVRAADSLKVAGSFANLNTLVEGFEDYFGTYHWDRVGYVAVPFNYGAMEHAMNIAYPRIVINGNLSYEYLVAHELSHSWFGNLVTCASAPEMWINEGWAVFSEYIYMEIIYGSEAAREYMRAEHKMVLQEAHITDAGYRAVHGVPHEYTYGTTVYNKGGLVVHAMRHYLGDSLFFNTVRAYTEAYKFDNISTIEMRDFFSATTGVDLNDFFDAWVYRPGFSTFIADSFHVEQVASDYEVEVYFRQLLRGTTEYALSNKFEVLFLGDGFETQTETVWISGEHGSAAFTLAFEPKAILIDPMDKTAFATTKYNQLFNETGSVNFPYTFCRLDVNELKSDSIRVFIRHHWSAPDQNVAPGSQIYRVSDARYWEIDGAMIGTEDIAVRFQYNKSTSISTGNLDNTLLPSLASTDSLVLLYRPAAGFDWAIIPFTKSGTAYAGNLITPYLIPGQYTLGVGEPNQSGVLQYEQTNNNIMKVFPNPSNGHFTIEIDEDYPKSSLWIFNSMGKQIDCIPMQGTRSVEWKPNGNPAGMYIIQLRDNRKKVMLDSKSVIYEK